MHLEKIKKKMEMYRFILVSEGFHEDIMKSVDKNNINSNERVKKKIKNIESIEDVLLQNDQSDSAIKESVKLVDQNLKEVDKKIESVKETIDSVLKVAKKLVRDKMNHTINFIKKQGDYQKAEDAIKKFKKKRAQINKIDAEILKLETLVHEIDVKRGQVESETDFAIPRDVLANLYKKVNSVVQLMPEKIRGKSPTLLSFLEKNTANQNSVVENQKSENSSSESEQSKPQTSEKDQETTKLSAPLINAELITTANQLIASVADSEIEKQVSASLVIAKAEMLLRKARMIEDINHHEVMIDRLLGIVFGRLQTKMDEILCFTLSELNYLLFVMMKHNIIINEVPFLDSLLNTLDRESAKRFIVYNYRVYMSDRFLDTLTQNSAYKEPILKSMDAYFSMLKSHTLSKTKA